MECSITANVLRLGEVPPLKKYAQQILINIKFKTYEYK